MPTRSEEFLPTRRSLLSRLRAWDDHESWHEFFAAYGKLIYSAAIRAGLKDAEAQDVVQETIISVAKEMPDFHYDPARGSFKGWLKQVTRRRIADHLRRKPPEELLLDRVPPDTAGAAPEQEHHPDLSTHPLDKVWDAEWRNHLMERAMDRLRQKVSARQFQIFELHVAQGLSVAEVARMLGVSAGQVYLSKHRLSRLLKQELRRLDLE